jgi:CheY-like chemotaxis protein
LARVSEAKSQFLASVSHELRTPMSAILGFTDLLLAGVDGPLNDEQRASLEWVKRGGQDLLGLINEILDLSKIEAGKLILDPAPFDPRELLESVVAQHRSLAAQKHIRFTWHDVDTPSEVVLDRQRVRQILVNLIGNALKFTLEGAVIVETGGVADATLRVTVRDTGPGIPLDQHEAIFDEFRQLEGTAVGTGLGLSISRRLARAMGGDIAVESQLGQGSVFHLSLPIHGRATLAGADSRSDDADNDKHIILTVTEHSSVTPLLQQMLAGHPYRVVASDGVETAREDARRLQPSAILLDIPFHGHDSDVLRQLKADPAISSIPVIVSTVDGADDVPPEAAGHLSKPIEQTALLQALAEHVPPEAAQ